MDRNMVYNITRVVMTKKNLTKVLLIFCIAFFTIHLNANNSEKNKLEASFYSFKSSNYTTFIVDDLGHPFSGQKNCIVRVAPEIQGLTGIKLTLLSSEKQLYPILKIHFNEQAWLLVGYFNNQEKLNQSPIIKNGLTITGLPPVNIYAFPYGKGTQELHIPFPGSYTILGIVKPIKDYQQFDAGLPDGRDWEPYVVEGLSDEKALFDIIGGSDVPVLDEGMLGTEGIQGGFEGGCCMKIGNTYHMFPTERAGEPGIEAYYDRVKTRIGHWESHDAIHWERKSTIYQSSGVYAVTDDDNPINDRRGAIWSFMPVYNDNSNRWNGFYLAYTVSREYKPNHSFGRIWRCESVQKGLDGIAGPYMDRGIVMEPGLNSQLWEGRQGVDSFFPYKVGNKWLSFYGGAFPYENWADYPIKYYQKWWGVGLAISDSVEGPWVRMDTTINPVTSMHPWFIENPIVSELPNGILIAIFDGGPDGWGLHLPNMFGYSLSKDGIHWSEAHYFPIRKKVKKWWDIMRTPLCLIPEGNDIYTVVFAGINNQKRFHPMGMVKLKLNREVLEMKSKIIEP